MPGPYSSEAEALAEPMPQAVRALRDSGRVRSGDPDYLVRGTVLAAITDACAQAGVEVGDYDRRVLRWLAEWDTGSAQVVIGIIGRAHTSGKAGKP